MVPDRPEMGYVVKTKTPRSARPDRGTHRIAFALLLLAVLVAPSPAAADFGISTFTVTARTVAGTIDQRAASHPFALDIHLAVNTDQNGEPEDTLREIRTDLPPGLLGNPLATPRCSLLEFASSPPGCAAATQIGILRGIVTDIGQITTPVYNLEPLPGSAATFGISVNGEPHMQRLTLADAGAGSSIRLRMVLPSEPAIVDVEEEIWGVPADPAHDPERVCRDAEEAEEGCSSEAAERPLLTLPASCAEPLRTILTAVSADEPKRVAVATAFSRDAGGNPSPLAGCDAVPFDPRLTLQIGGSASAPTSLAIGLEVPQYEGAELAAASLAALQVDFPQGLALNPSAGAWLSGCPPSAIGAAGSCPASSRLGSVKMWTPMVDHPLNGSIYLATPSENPFGSRYVIYLVIEDEATGTVLKIPGRLEADPEDGRLGATIADLPQIPFERLELEFAGGSRAPLAAPPICGEYPAEAVLTPSTAPFALPVTRTAAFALSTGPGFGPCPPPEAERNAAPSFQAGTVSAAAGTDSPLAIQLSRNDTDQHFGSFELTLPPGLVANLGSLPFGTAVGSVEVEAGLGAEPLVLNGTAYLEGPYRGAPYSLAVVVPVRAGPFDLGTIAERMAVRVDPATAQLSVRSDSLPRILAGVPLELRRLRIDLDRPGFIRNPTSCKPAAIAGSAITAVGQSAPLSAGFRVANCAGLPFQPRLSVHLLGSTARGAHPTVRATLRPGRSIAALERLVVTLPGSELLDAKRIGAICALPAAEIENCPTGSAVAHLEARTPLLSGPLAGPVFLRPSTGRLPGLTAVLDGAVQLRLSGHIGSANGRIRFGFTGLPDAPFDELTLRVAGGRKGILVNSGGVCSGARRLTATLSSHGGRVLTAHPRLRARCPGHVG